MPLGRGKRHTAKEHRIFNAIKRSSPGRSDKSVWKNVMAMSSKQRGRKGSEPNTINYRGRRKKR